MEAMRQSWTDERLDDFRGSVDRRFDETNQRMEAGFAQVNSRLDSIESRLAGLHQMLHQATVAFGVGLLGLIAALIGVIAVRL
jgi:tetrahydromethanopterin S-methyltransferase subunit G